MSAPPTCGYTSGGASNGPDGASGASCAAPKQMCFADNKVQVGSGVRGNDNFAKRAKFQACYDAKLYKMCNPRDGSTCETIMADGVATCQMNVDKRSGMAGVCPTYTNAGFLDPSTASLSDAVGVYPATEIDGTTGLCVVPPDATRGPKASPAQACLEDLTPAQLKTAGVAREMTTGSKPSVKTYTSKIPRRVVTMPVLNSSGVMTSPKSTKFEGDFTYTSPAVGQNAVMRMSRTPVFFDATKKNAAQYLSQSFYAMHKRWGGSDNASCCGGPNIVGNAKCCAAGDKTCTINTKQQGATCTTPTGTQCPNPSHQSVCDHPHDWWNGGVRKENIYLASRDGAPDGATAASQQTLCLRIQGQEAKIGSASTTKDAASGLPALGRTVALGESDVSNMTTMGNRKLVACETCKAYPIDSTNAQRVGAILTSAQNYGSGLFEVYARIPPGNKHESGGLGYVFAMWTFNYHETYPLYPPPPAASTFPNIQVLNTSFATAEEQEKAAKLLTKGGGWALDPAGQQLAGNLISNPMSVKHMEFKGGNRFSCGLYSHNCDQTTNWCPAAEYGAVGERACGIGGSELNDGPFTTWNHEIDIEIPTNAARIAKTNTCNLASTAPTSRPAVPPEGICGWNTDTINLNSWIGDDEDYMDGSPYRNNGVRRMDGKSFIARKQNDYHWYGFVWCTGDDSSGRKPYIDFYIDRKLMHRITDTFIPSRAGKLNIGPWFGWWGGQANFANKEVWLKYINIIPFAAVNDPFNDAPTSGSLSKADITTLAKNWTGDAAPSTTLSLPQLTGAELNQLYMAVIQNSQTDAPPPPADWRLQECDMSNATNDINAPQVFDQCGNSSLRNICDFNEFLVQGKDGMPSAYPGQVLGSIEPRKCVRYNEKGEAVGGVTQGQKFTIDGTNVETLLDATLDRSQYFDITVDPDPNMTDNVRAFFPQNQFTPGAHGEPAKLVGDPTVKEYCFVAKPPPPPSSASKSKASKSSASKSKAPKSSTAKTALAAVNPTQIAIPAPCGGTRDRSMWIGLSIGFIVMLLLAIAWCVWRQGRRK